MHANSGAIHYAERCAVISQRLVIYPDRTADSMAARRERKVEFRAESRPGNYSIGMIGLAFRILLRAESASV